MLHHLSIQNYATVDSLEIELKTGMTVLTGETGAGKSITLGALGLMLGDRAELLVRIRTEAEHFRDRLRSDEARAALMAFMSRKRA